MRTAQIEIFTRLVKYLATLADNPTHDGPSRPPDHCPYVNPPLPALDGGNYRVAAGLG